MKTKLLALLFIFILPSISFAYKVGDKLSDDTITKIGASKDNIVIVDFFASWCVSCEKELPLINKLNKSLDKRVKIIGINTDEDINEGISFQKRLNLSFEIINDNNHQLVNNFSPIGMPALYYIKDFKVEKIIFGAVDNIDEVIKNDLKGM